MKIYELYNPKDLDKLNRQVKAVGLTIQKDLFGEYIAILDDGVFKKIITRNAGRRSVKTPQVILSVLQYRYEGLTISEIAKKTNVSKGIVTEILKKHTSRDIILPEQLSLYDL